MSTQALPDGCTALVKFDPEKSKSLEMAKQIYDSPVWGSPGEFSVVVGFDPGRGDESVGVIWHFRDGLMTMIQIYD